MITSTSTTMRAVVQDAPQLANALEAEATGVRSTAKLDRVAPRER